MLYYVSFRSTKTRSSIEKPARTLTATWVIADVLDQCQMKKSVLLVQGLPIESAESANHDGHPWNTKKHWVLSRSRVLFNLEII